MKMIPFLMLVLAMGNLLAGNSPKSSTGLATAVKMADSEITHFPEPWTVDYNPNPVWNYTQGLISQAMLQLWEVTRNKKYFQYAKAYADKMIDSSGVIRGYKMEEYSLDRLNSGKYLFDLYRITGDARYKKAVFTLRNQLKTHPRTSEGGFWHKKVYPSQMWLDGLYMAAPFYVRFGMEFGEPDVFNDVVSQFIVVQKHTHDTVTGLNFHGWDESGVQPWADPATGCSPHVWGRAMGWYFMALADVLDFIPADHPRRGEILFILSGVAESVMKHQDKKTGLWYQVMDQGSREGNYLEATASSMFVYSLLKSVRMGYIGKNYRETAVRGYKGILEYLLKDNSDGTVSLTRCCSVAGLGGNPYRDGTFEYYVHEPVRDNDPKGVGPFIMASLEFQLLK
jgi:unsaturated rhamnogalacturonyl hydrolase